MKLGLKLWSINRNYQEPAKRLFARGVFDYIELYVVPDSYRTFIRSWQDLGIPYQLHAPHFKHGMNLAKREAWSRNRQLFAEAQAFADDLEVNFIVTHPGTDGDIYEAVRQFNKLKEERILIENKPYFALFEELVCNGASLEELRILRQETGLDTCLDFGHAICAANAFNIDAFEFLEKFMVEFKPEMFHVSDGEFHAKLDQHWHLGKGDYPLKELRRLIPKDKLVSLETEKDSKSNLDDFEKDVKYFFGL